jgi:sucrose-6-phosphate hydrolase SacC (GH32 family)
VKRILVVVSFFLFCINVIACSPTETEEIMENENHLHYILPVDEYDYPFIGDVHPFFDEDSNTWYMFYLDTSGSYNSSLLTSQNGLNWVPTEFKVHSGFQNYAVLNVFKKDNDYYSYYADYQASTSTDLLNWYYAGGEYKIDQDSASFPGGSRDPDVVYDEETNRYYSISINYIQHGGPYISNLAIGSTVGDDQTEWYETHKAVLSENVVNSDYECPQLVKIGDRWYIFASRYGQSVHGVGRLSYFMGDKGVNPYDMDWTKVEERFLTTEDLAAAQVESKDGKFYVFGWIPRYFNLGFWGGFINLPTEVYQLEDGTLATRISSDISDLIRGEKIGTINAEKVLNTTTTSTIDIEKRFDVEAYFTLSDGVMEINFDRSNTIVAIENTESFQKVTVSVENYQTAEMILRPGSLEGTNYIRIIGEGRNIEVFLNNQYTIVSRLEEEFLRGKMTFSLVYGNSSIVSADSYRLKYREELLNEGEKI